MEITVYNGEYFERGKTWFMIFTLFVVFFVIINILFGNIWGVIVFFIVLGIYFYFLLQSQKKIKLKIAPEGLYIDNNFYPWSSFAGFTIEIDPITKQVKNVVLVLQNGNYMIYTIADDEDKFKQFTLALADYIPLVESYYQSFFDRLLRVLKL